MAKSLVVLLVMALLAILLSLVSREWSQWVGGTSFFGLVTWWTVNRSRLGSR